MSIKWSDFSLFNHYTSMTLFLFWIQTDLVSSVFSLVKEEPFQFYVSPTRYLNNNAITSIPFAIFSGYTKLRTLLAITNKISLASLNTIIKWPAIEFYYVHRARRPLWSPVPSGAVGIKFVIPTSTYEYLHLISFIKGFLAVILLWP